MERETVTLGQVKKIIDFFIKKHGSDFPIRVDTTYDQGCNGMEITDIVDAGEYIAIEA